MEEMYKISVWRQYGAAIDYLDATMNACPDALWTSSLWAHEGEKPEFSQFWYRVYHTLFWIDCYLYGTEEGFLPPAPFELIEQTDDGPIPARAYTKLELQGYLKDCRAKCKATIDGLTDEQANKLCVFGWGQCSYYELLIYTMRHVQDHTAALNLMLGQQLTGPIPDYAIQAK